MEMYSVTGRSSFRRRAKLSSFDRKRFAAFLRGIYPTNTAACIADDVGVSDRTADNWLGEKSEPRTSHFMRMVGLYGVETIEAAYPTAMTVFPWLGTAQRTERLAGLQEQLARVQAAIDEERS